MEEQIQNELFQKLLEKLHEGKIKSFTINNANEVIFNLLIDNNLFTLNKTGKMIGDPNYTSIKEWQEKIATILG